MQLLLSLTRVVKNNVLLTTFIVVGFLLRVISVSPGYYYPIGDELLFGQALHMLLNQTLEFESPYFGFPPLIPWIMLPIFTTVFIPFAFLKTLVIHVKEIYIYLPIFIVPFSALLLVTKRIFRLTKAKTIVIGLLLVWIAFTIGGVVGIKYIPIFQREILGRDWIKALYWGRYLTAFVGTGAIFLTYKVTEVYFDNKKISLLAALFVALNYRLVISSHVGLPDMYNVFFLLLALLVIGYLIKKGSLDQYFIAILSMATFFMIKYQTQVLIPFIIAHIGISLRNVKGSAVKFLKNLLNPGVLLAGLLGLAYILIAHYYHFVNFDKVLEINRYEAIKYGFGRNLFDIFPISYFFHIGIGAQLSIASIVGIIFGIINKKRRFPSIVLISTLPMFGFLYLYYTNGGYYTRNLISAVPVILIFAGVAVDALLQKLLDLNPKPKILSWAAIIVLIFFFIKDNFYNSVTAAKAYSQEAPRVSAQKWVDQNIKPGVKLGRYSGNPSPVDPMVQVENMTPYYRAVSYKELLSENYEYVVIDITYVRDFFAWWTRQAPSTAIKFWIRPNDLLSQNYISLAFRELLWSYGQALFISPWQAPSDNFAVVKIQKEAPTFSNLDLLKRYNNFDNSWVPLAFTANNKDNLEKVDGGNNNQILSIKNRDFLPGSIRFQSEAFEIKPGYGYKVIAKIKNDVQIPKDERDGFIRLDFYKDNIPANILSRSTASFVSERVYGESNVHTVTLVGTAPTGTKFANISFQADGTSYSSFYLYEISVYQTKQPVMDNGQHLIINDSDLFLPNNAGIL